MFVAGSLIPCVKPLSPVAFPGLSRSLARWSAGRCSLGTYGTASAVSRSAAICGYPGRFGLRIRADPRIWVTCRRNVPGYPRYLYRICYALPTSLVRVHLVHRMNTLPARLGYSGGLCEALLGVSRVARPQERSVTGTYDLRERLLGQPLSVVIGPAKNLTHRT